jgi:hypothetical protein
MSRAVLFLLLSGCNAGYLYVNGPGPVVDDTADADADADDDADADADSDTDTDTGVLPLPEDISVWEGTRTYEQGTCYDVANETGQELTKKDEFFAGMAAACPTCIAFWRVVVANPTICDTYDLDAEVYRGLIFNEDHIGVQSLYTGGSTWFVLPLGTDATWDGETITYDYRETLEDITFQVAGEVSFPGAE